MPLSAVNSVGRPQRAQIAQTELELGNKHNILPAQRTTCWKRRLARELLRDSRFAGRDGNKQAGALDAFVLSPLALAALLSAALAAPVIDSGFVADRSSRCSHKARQQFQRLYYLFFCVGSEDSNGPREAVNGNRVRSREAALFALERIALELDRERERIRTAPG